MEPMRITDELVKGLCIRLAKQAPGVRTMGIAKEDAGSSSRRGFLRTVGKLTVGAAAVVTGTTLFNRPAEAATALHCCEGIACGFHGCVHGMAIGYTWSCGGYFCHDCFTDYGNGNYYCTYTVARTATVHYTSQHATHSTARRTTHRRARTTTYYSPPEYYTPDYYYGPPPGYFGD